MLGVEHGRRARHPFDELAIGFAGVAQSIDARTVAGLNQQGVGVAEDDGVKRLLGAPCRSAQRRSADSSTVSAGLFIVHLVSPKPAASGAVSDISPMNSRFGTGASLSKVGRATI